MPTAILAFITQVLPVLIQAFPTVIKGVEDLRPFVTQLFLNLTGKTATTDEEQAAIEALIQNLSDQLQQPLDP